MKKYRKFRDYYNSKKNKKWRAIKEARNKLYRKYNYQYFYSSEVAITAKVAINRAIHNRIIHKLFNTYRVNLLFRKSKYH